MRKTDNTIVRVLRQVLRPPGDSVLPATTGSVVFEISAQDPPGSRTAATADRRSIDIDQIGDVSELSAQRHGVGSDRRCRLDISVNDCD